MLRPQNNCGNKLNRKEEALRINMELMVFVMKIAQPILFHWMLLLLLLLWLPDPISGGDTGGHISEAGMFNEKLRTFIECSDRSEK